MMTSEAKEKLKEQLKGKLNITWQNDNTETKLDELVVDAEIWMNHVLGAEVDYSVPSLAHILFKEYCMYVWNACGDEFEDAYRKDINRVRAIYEVESYENEEEKNSESE